jgi:hypothetical protein
MLYQLSHFRSLDLRICFLSLQGFREPCGRYYIDLTLVCQAKSGLISLNFRISSLVLLFQGNCLTLINIGWCFGDVLEAVFYYMQIILTFNDKLLESYGQKKKTSVPFGISFYYDNIYYPAKYWEDFGEVLLSWWIGALIRLLRGTEEDEFLFMDGSYSIKLCYRKKDRIVKLRPIGLDCVWEVSIHQLIDLIISAANSVSKELKIRNIEEKEGLEKCVSLLREAQGLTKL